jgi:hypothetical protein
MSLIALSSVISCESCRAVDGSSSIDGAERQVAILGDELRDADGSLAWSDSTAKDPRQDRRGSEPRLPAETRLDQIGDPR